jgi:hypothetical protein
MLLKEASDVLPGKPAADHTMPWMVLLAEAWQQQGQPSAYYQSQKQEHQQEAQKAVTYRENTFCDLQLTERCWLSC